MTYETATVKCSRCKGEFTAYLHIAPIHKWGVCPDCQADAYWEAYDRAN